MKKLLACLLVVVMLLGMAACAQQEPEIQPTEPTPPPTMAAYEPNPKTIHVLIPATTEGWEGKAAQQAVDVAEEIQAEGSIAVVTQEYGSAEQQIKLLEEIAAAGPNDGSVGVVLMPAGEGVEEALQKLLEANVAYALAENIPASAAAASVANVYYDHRQIGAAAAAYLVNAGMTQKNDVVVLEGVSSEDVLKTEGFKLYLQGKLEVNGQAIETPWDNFSTIVYSEMEGANREGARNYFEYYMEDGDRAWTGYFAAWDDEYVLGMLDALEGDAITSTNRGRLFDMEPTVAGFGATDALLQVLNDTETDEDDTYVDDFHDINTQVYDSGMLAQALRAMADHMAGQIVEQEQILDVQWVKEQPVKESDED